MTRRVSLIRYTLFAAGGAALAYAAYGVLGSHDTRFAYLRFLTLVLIGHELVLMPLATLLGVLIGRLTSARSRPVIQAAVFASAVITVVALPGVLGYGRTSDLPSALPRDYGRGLLIALLAIWGTAVIALTVRRRKHSAPDK